MTVAVVTKRSRIARVLLVALAGLGAAAGCGSGDSECDVSGHACTWLGMPGQTGFNGDGHDRLDTMLYWTMDVQVARDGAVWFIDWNNHLVRKVKPDGQVVSVVGWNDPVFPGDGDQADPTAEYSAAGAPGIDVQLNHPTDLRELSDGTILLMAWHNHKLRKIDPATGRVWVVSGSGAGFAGDGGPAAMALYKQPSHMVLDEHENIYVLDQQNLRVRRIDAQTQIITTVAGTGVAGFAGDQGQALQAQLNFKVGDNPEPSGGMAYKAGTLYIADSENNRIRSIDLQTGVITTLAGTGQMGYAGDDGPAAQAMLYHPRDLEIGPDGDLYLADTDNGRIRAINLTSGVIRTVVGTGQLGLDPDDDRLATATQLNRPFGIAFDPKGNLLVCDSLNSRLLRVAR
jgi:DNA-binding beta-propeller fold protein YncE